MSQVLQLKYWLRELFDAHTSNVKVLDPPAAIRPQGGRQKGGARLEGIPSQGQSVAAVEEVQPGWGLGQEVTV